MREATASQVAAGATRKGEPDFSLPTLSAESLHRLFLWSQSLDRQAAKSACQEANYDDDEEEEEDAGEHDEFMEAAENLLEPRELQWRRCTGALTCSRHFYRPDESQVGSVDEKEKEEEEKKRKRAKCPTGLSERRRLSSFHVTT